MSLQVYEIVCGQFAPDESIRIDGKLPEDWEAVYTASLAESLAGACDSENISAEIVDAVHWASFHLWIRYLSWLGNNDPNLDTEAALGRIQLESELFFWNSLPTTPPLSSHDVNQHESEIIRLSLFDNSLSSSQASQAGIDMWAQEYRVQLAEIRQRWDSVHVWNKWTVQAIRFASIYFGIAHLATEGKALVDKELGLFPDRITQTVDRFRPVLPIATVELLSRWLRLAHLRRSSSGVPELVSPCLEPLRFKVRTISEGILQLGRINR